ncbi:MAG: pyridoxamine 5'-phosphate oxidase family protein [Acidobacteria bacterium]|nr:pyridoxamine 5'-phosphate oxidase family protein [Acidobacteriota bacterium]
MICHVAFVIDGAPRVIPTAYGRDGERIYVHGSAASRMLRTLSGGAEVCVTVTLLDGLVLARSAFHHSLNYRSVMIFGPARLVDDPAEKNEALRIISEHLIPGRWADVRPPSEKETAATSVLAIDLNEVSAKLRTGNPVDDDEDLAVPAWAGVLPLELPPGTPVDDGLVPEGIPVPDYASGYRRKR